MARKQKLKVYRTPIGFHDAYVAATSQKAALKAWGADVDLFARGVAEAVTDAELTKEPLAYPGTVVRVLRGTNEEHVAALPEGKPKTRRRSSPAEVDEGPPPRRRTRSGNARQSGQRSIPASEHGAVTAREPERKPAARRKKRSRPSRETLDRAEQAIERAEADHAEKIANLREKERRLHDERRALEERHEVEIAGLEAVRDRIRNRYTAALQKWQD